MSYQTTSVLGRTVSGGFNGQQRRRAWLLSVLSDGLPTLPGYVFELNRLLSDSPVDLAQVTRILRTDVSLSAQVLRLGNRSTAGQVRPVYSVGESVSLLGAKRLRTLLMTTSLLEYVGKKLAVGEVQAFWQHCFLTALLSEHIALLTGFEDSERAYTAGLLHDLGILPLIMLSMVEEPAGESDLDPEGNLEGLLQEQQRFGMDHCEVGHWIGVSWNFPPEFIEVLECHHEPSRATQNPRLVGIAAAADQICELRGITSGGVPPRLSDAGPAQYHAILQRCLPDLNSAKAWRLAEELQDSFMMMFQLLEFTSSGTFGGVEPNNTP